MSGQRINCEGDRGYSRGCVHICLKFGQRGPWAARQGWLIDGHCQRSHLVEGGHHE